MDGMQHANSRDRERGHGHVRGTSTGTRERARMPGHAARALEQHVKASTGCGAVHTGLYVLPRGSRKLKAIRTRVLVFVHGSGAGLIHPD